VLDVGIAHLAALWELEHGVGEFWWISILKALGGGTSDTSRAPQQQNVRWL